MKEIWILTAGSKHAIWVVDTSIILFLYLILLFVTTISGKKWIVTSNYNFFTKKKRPQKACLSVFALFIFITCHIYVSSFIQTSVVVKGVVSTKKRSSKLVHKCNELIKIIANLLLFWRRLNVETKFIIMYKIALEILTMNGTTNIRRI